MRGSGDDEEKGGIALWRMRMDVGIVGWLLKILVELEHLRW